MCNGVPFSQVHYEVGEMFIGVKWCKKIYGIYISMTAPEWLGDYWKKVQRLQRDIERFPGELSEWRKDLYYSKDRIIILKGSGYPSDHDEVIEAKDDVKIAEKHLRDAEEKFERLKEELRELQSKWSEHVGPKSRSPSKSKGGRNKKSRRKMSRKNKSKKYKGKRQ
jgi:hypothetical protein